MTKEDHYNRGMELYAEDKMGEAIEAYQKALEEDSTASPILPVTVKETALGLKAIRGALYSVSVAWKNPKSL